MTASQMPESRTRSLQAALPTPTMSPLTYFFPLGLSFPVTVTSLNNVIFSIYTEARQRRKTNEGRTSMFEIFRVLNFPSMRGAPTAPTNLSLYSRVTFVTEQHLPQEHSAVWENSGSGNGRLERCFFCLFLCFFVF